MSKKIEESVMQLVAPVAAQLGYEVVDVEYLKKKNEDSELIIYIDKEGGVDLNACEKFHRAIDLVLDEIDPTFGAPYTLNVSSPGLDRPLKTERDFKKCLNEKVEVKLFAPIKGKKFFEAKLVGFDENCVELEDKNGTLKLEKSKIAKICRAIDFDGLE